MKQRGMLKKWCLYGACPNILSIGNYKRTITMATRSLEPLNETNHFIKVNECSKYNTNYRNRIGL